MYGYSKHLFDLHTQRKGWLDSSGLKYFNVYDPADHKDEMRSLVNKAYQQICRQILGYNSSWLQTGIGMESKEVYRQGRR